MAEIKCQQNLIYFNIFRCEKWDTPEISGRSFSYHEDDTEASEKALLTYRKNLKGRDDTELSEIASKLWELRWSLLKKPSYLREEERKEIEKPEKRDSGFITEFRTVICHIVNISDYPNTEVQAEIKLKNLKRRIGPIGNKYLNKISIFSDEHWQEAMQFLRKRGLAKHGRSSDSESGMRILRRMEKKS
jgi:hypothetical protein